MSVTQNVLRNTPEPLSSNQPPPSGPPVGRRRMVEAVAGIGVIAVWIVSGFLLERGFLGVVLLGVLLLAAFQTLVRRRPLRTLLDELVTHTSGYAEFGAATLRRAARSAPLGRNFLTADSTQMTKKTPVRSGHLDPDVGKGHRVHAQFQAPERTSREDGQADP